MENFWSYFIGFLGIVSGHIFGKFVTDSIKVNIGIQAIYKVSVKYLFRLATVLLMFYSFVSIKLFTPSEKQKWAIIGTAIVLAFVIHLRESKGEWKVTKTIEKTA